MNVQDVRRSVRAGRATKSPAYHAGKHGLGFQEILHALETCYHVAKDDRRDAAGEPAHPEGWYALSRLPHRRELRIDFNLHENASGEFILVVTAYVIP